MTYLYLPLLSPILLVAAASLSLLEPGRRPRRLLVLGQLATLATIFVALTSIGLLITKGAGTTPLIGLFGAGISIRLDVISVTMNLLVSFVGWVVIRYAVTYMDGEERQGKFIGCILAALASVLMLVLAGNLIQLLLAWIITNHLLHRLLLHYPERAAAVRAARKKTITARASEIALFLAVALLIGIYGTTDIATLNAQIQTSALTTFIGLCIAIAAILASAQFPAHGWLTEVMEAPTPVSALLHAGVINAGGFLLIRLADVMLAASGILALLAILGGFTALFASLVMLTQPAVKTSLAWSTIAQMGFMIFQCGLALFPLALLHIVAHSLYKAHAFLSSGAAIADIAANLRPGPVAVPSLAKVLQAFGVAIAIFLLVGLIFGLETKSVQSIALGMILIFGVAYLLAQGLADAAPAALTQRTVLYSAATSLSYFFLQTAAEFLTHGTLPPTPAPQALEWALLLLALTSFGAVALAQATFPLWAPHPAAAGIRVHLSNGLYVNTLFDRFIGGWKTEPKPSSHEN
ncbi:MAG: proton-conducting transporter membrane subunit [Aestuariivita sp.]|nr:proton-conducting transporter membrane subunit [Aestuariivita sp.]MCY4347654.1 proton-conducting transporter membrane subunit [Aestuariivita sp.]